MSTIGSGADESSEFGKTACCNQKVIQFFLWASKSPFLFIQVPLDSNTDRVFIFTLADYVLCASSFFIGKRYVVYIFCFCCFASQKTICLLTNCFGPQKKTTTTNIHTLIKFIYENRARYHTIPSIHNHSAIEINEQK